MRNILVAIDFSDVTDALTSMANTLAAACQSKIYLLHVSNRFDELLPNVSTTVQEQEYIAEQLREESRQLLGLAMHLRDKGRECEPLIVEGPTVEKILAEIWRLNIDLVILGAHGHTRLHDVLIGNVRRGVLRKGGVPVLIVPNELRRRPEIVTRPMAERETAEA
jgi:nucleotide-binding universal stress UspA family protein